MGLIRGLLKLTLSILFILSLVSFVILSSLSSPLQENTFKAEFKEAIRQNNQFVTEIDRAYQKANEYFFIFNKTEDFVVEGQPFNLTITKQDANLSNQEFSEVVLEKIADYSYNAEQETPFGFLSIKGFVDKTNRYSKIFMTFSILLGLTLFVLFSGRFVLLGANFLIVSVFYYPTKFMFLTIGRKIKNSLPEFFANFMNNLILNSYNVSSRFFLWLFITGIVLVVIGILIKFLKIGLWFQGLFESKKNK